MSDEPAKHLDFMIEANAEYIPAVVLRNAIMIRDDPSSSLREKMLADILAFTIESHNKTVDALRHGTAVLRVFEKNMHRNVPRPPRDR